MAYANVADLAQISAQAPAVIPGFAAMLQAPLQSYQPAIFNIAQEALAGEDITDRLNAIAAAFAIDPSDAQCDLDAAISDLAH